MAEIVDLDAASTTPAAPEPAPAAAPVEQVKDFEPDWLNELSNLMEGPAAPPQYPNPYYPPPPPPQYYQPPPQPQQYYAPPVPQGPPKGDLDFLLENPRDYIANVASQATAGQQHYVRQMEAQVGRLMANSAQQTYNHAAQAVADGYKNVLNRDNTFKGNENVRRTVEGMLQRAMSAVQFGISRGDFNAGSALRDPTFFPALLYTAKLKCGVGFRGGEAIQPAGATMEYVSPPVQTESQVQLDPDLQMVADALGPAYAKQLSDAVREANQRGDVIW